MAPHQHGRDAQIWYRLAEAETRAVMRSLPEPLRARLADVVIRYEEAPGPELLSEGFGDDLLGLFSGATCAEPADAVGPLPATITLYIANLRDEAQDDRTRFRQEVRTTLLHEVGHYLGLDEDAIEARGC
ncbi:MAG: metallopeptidase family protein [Kiritimatiellae bacterium]|nr:metallopeptidase family protein [Kiritimatiellia bacterium]